MIFLSLGNKSIKGSKINEALERIKENKKLCRFTCVVDESNISFEFVPRVSERHYRKEYSFFLEKGKSEFILYIIPFNPDLSYREIGIIPYDTTRSEEEFCYKEELYCNDKRSTTITTLATNLVMILLKELGVVPK